MHWGQKKEQKVRKRPIMKGKVIQPPCLRPEFGVWISLSIFELLEWNKLLVFAGSVKGADQQGIEAFLYI